MIKIKINPFCRLPATMPGYVQDNGLEVELTVGSNSIDLFGVAKIPHPRLATLIADGHILKSEDEISSGSTINIFHIMYGG